MGWHMADLKSPGLISSCLRFLYTDSSFEYTLILGGGKIIQNYLRPRVVDFSGVRV